MPTTVPESDADPRRRGVAARPPGDMVDEAGRESFPSSDPPAGWAGEDDPEDGVGAVSS